MSDAALASRPFPGYTTAQLKVIVAIGGAEAAVVAEIARREQVAAGDMSVATPAERLRVANGQRP